MVQTISLKHYFINYSYINIVRTVLLYMLFLKKNLDLILCDKVICKSGSNFRLFGYFSFSGCHTGEKNLTNNM